MPTDDDECVYCHATIAASDVDTVPAWDDDDGWTRLALAHEDDCEWIATRAHMEGNGAGLPRG